MNATSTTTAEIVNDQLRSVGIALVDGPLERRDYLRLAHALGQVVGEESIALRPGAHAYVAKPGPVPLHTDHPEVAVVSWWCERQDETDGASRLLDTRPEIDALTAAERRLLCDVELWCPPLAGGPPTLRFPVLRETKRGPALFCSPWLRSANDDPAHVLALEMLRNRLSNAAKHDAISIRLEHGAALFIDNQRILHGRNAIDPTSRRRLHRLWIAR